MQLPPIVAPGPELSREEIARYSRHLLIPDVGVEGQRRLKNSRVLVIGAGGLGSPTLLYLAAAGVGTLGIVDFDRVEASNLQRQVIHSHATLGWRKTESARASITGLNPDLQVDCHNDPLTVENALTLIEQYDLVLDGTDNFATRYLVNDACVLAGKPYVWGSIFRFEGQASVFWEQAPGGMGRNYRDLYPEPPPPHLAPSCSEGGVLGVLCAAIGSVMATEAIKLITGTGESLLGRLLTYDALDMAWRTLPLMPAPDRKPITALQDYQQFCGAVPTDQPVEPVPAVSARELEQRRSRGDRFQLIDVRESTEWDIVRIEGARHIPKDRLLRGDDVDSLPKDQPLIVHCKVGGRSRQVVKALQARGFTNVLNLDGGILAWIRDVEPSLPTY